MAFLPFKKSFQIHIPLVNHEIITFGPSFIFAAFS